MYLLIDLYYMNVGKKGTGKKGTGKMGPEKRAQVKN